MSKYDLSRLDVRAFKWWSFHLAAFCAKDGTGSVNTVTAPWMGDRDWLHDHTMITSMWPYYAVTSWFDEDGDEHGLSPYWACEQCPWQCTAYAFYDSHLVATSAKKRRTEPQDIMANVCACGTNDAALVQRNVHVVLSSTKFHPLQAAACGVRCGSHWSLPMTLAKRAALASARAVFTGSHRVYDMEA
jgi:hypothetical protein